MNANPDAARPTASLALPLIGCGAILGVIVATLVLWAGRALGVLVALAVAFLAGLALWRARHRSLAVRRFRKRYGPEGKDLLIVYTASPHWQAYIEREWLPRWGDRAVVLNRTQPWDPNGPEGHLWFMYRGVYEHTPMAIVVPARGRVRAVRFFKAFRDYKHGKDARLRARERELEAAIAGARRGGR